MVISVSRKLETMSQCPASLELALGLRAGDATGEFIFRLLVLSFDGVS